MVPSSRGQITWDPYPERRGPSRPSSALPADGLRGGSGPFSSCPGRPNVPFRGIAWRREKKSLWDVPAPNQQCVSPGCDPECWGRGVGTLCRLQDVPLGRRITGQPSWVTWDLEADLSFVLFGFHLGLRLLCAGGNCALLLVRMSHQTYQGLLHFHWLPLWRKFWQTSRPRAMSLRLQKE